MTPVQKAASRSVVAAPKPAGGAAPASILRVARLAAGPELVLPLAVLGIVMAMITPLPSFVLDVLISANITMSVIVLLVSMYIGKPTEFSVFPTTLLLMTLFRLALNIS